MQNFKVNIIKQATNFLVLEAFLLQTLFTPLSLYAQDLYYYQINLDQNQINTIKFVPITPQPSALFPEYYQMINPFGVSFGGSLKLPGGQESFSILPLADKNLVTAPGQYLGGGIIQFDGKDPLVYSDLYTVKTFAPSKEVFTVGLGIKNKDLFLGVGSPYQAQGVFIDLLKNFNDSKHGFILPTGSGILLSPNGNMNQPFNVTYQALNSAWEPLIKSYSPSNNNQYIEKSVPINSSFLTSNQFQWKENFNPMSDYFPKSVVQTIFPNQKTISTKDLVQYYEKTDPTGLAGPYQVSYSMPNERVFEYATSKGFHYSVSPVKDLEYKWTIENPQLTAVLVNTEKNNVIAKEYLPLNNNWYISSSVQKTQSVDDDLTLRRFSRKDGGTAEIYQSNDKLYLNSAYNNTWKEKAKLEYSEKDVLTRYEKGF